MISRERDLGLADLDNCPYPDGVGCKSECFCKVCEYPDRGGCYTTSLDCQTYGDCKNFVSWLDKIVPDHAAKRLREIAIRQGRRDNPFGASSSLR